MPREPKHASNRQTEADLVGDQTSRRQMAIDGELPSRNQLKQQMQDLQELGEALATLPTERLDALKIEERLRDAIAELHRTRSFEGKRRQIQYIGKLMKFEDPEPLREAVASYRVGSAKDTLTMHQAEYWRDQLVATDDMLANWLKDYPATDVQQLRSLVRAARKEKLEPGERHGRAYRDLFRMVKGLMLDVPDAGDDEPASDPSHDD
ncbi:MAG: ribosome biogenesis factor YjgA [Betaproteobacteria bacterium]